MLPSIITLLGITTLFFFLFVMPLIEAVTWFPSSSLYLNFPTVFVVYFFTGTAVAGIYGLTFGDGLAEAAGASVEPGACVVGACVDAGVDVGAAVTTGVWEGDGICV